MTKPSHRKPLLTAQAINELQNAKRQIMAGAVGRVPEPLLLATAQAAVRLARGQARPSDVLSERVVALVRRSLKALAQQKWTPDTALSLDKCRKEGGLS